jgi:hypothetical protein
MSRSMCLWLAALLMLGSSACIAEESPTPGPTATEAPTAPPTAPLSPSSSPTTPASPTATPEPSLSLDPPGGTDTRVVAATVVADVGAEGGTLAVTVTSAADERIDELVLRWPTELNATLFVAPFTPTDDRIRDGGDPLSQPWTKWVVGPGEQGEPDGTISLGWGPLLPNATLEFELDVTRRADGPVAFDLQVLAGNDLLTFEGGEPAELRIEVP